MSIVGLHPEDLFDKLVNGELSPSDQERLRQHLEACDVCRFEYAARQDFLAEALSPALRAPPVTLLRPLVAEPEVPLRIAGSVAQRRRARFILLGLAAAAVVTASGALAARMAGNGTWPGLQSMFSEPTVKSALRTSGRISAPSKPAVAPQPEAPAATPSTDPSPLASSSRMGAPPRELRPERSVSPGAGRPAAKAQPLSDSAVHDSRAQELSSAAQLFADANEARRAGDIGRASKLYHLLQQQYAGSGEAELSRVTLALLLLDTGDARGALVGFESYLAGGLRGLEAEALVGRARALGRLGRTDAEAAAWQEVRRKYPRSIYGRQATERLSALGQP